MYASTWREQEILKVFCIQQEKSKFFTFCNLFPGNCFNYFNNEVFRKLLLKKEKDSYKTRRNWTLFMLLHGHEHSHILYLSGNEYRQSLQIRKAHIHKTKYMNIVFEMYKNTYTNLRTLNIKWFDTLSIFME